MANFDSFRERLLTDESVGRVRELKGVADELGITRAQLALAWVLRRSGVASVITGATRLEQLEDNLAAGGVTLSAEQLERIDGILNG